MAPTNKAEAKMKLRKMKLYRRELADIAIDIGIFATGSEKNFDMLDRAIETGNKEKAHKIVGKFKAKISKLDRAADALNNSLAFKYNTIVKDGVKAAVRLTNMKEEVNIDLTDSDSDDSEENEEWSEPQEAARRY